MTHNIKKSNLHNLTSLLIVCMVFFLPHISATASLDELIMQPLTYLPKELHEAPSVAIHENTVHVVWNTWHDEFTSKIYYKRSLDNGKTWGNTTKLSSDTIKAIYPVIDVNNTIVHVGWKDYKDGNPEVYYTNSFDNGETWSSPIRLTYNSSRKNNIYDIGIAAQDKNVYLTWKDYRTGSSEIFFKKSSDNGNIWLPDQELTHDIPPSYYPSLSVEDTNLYIVYEDGGTKPNIAFLKSINSGHDWNEKRFLIESSSASEKPYLTTQKNSLYLVWQDDRTGNREIYFKKSYDRGETWGEIQQLTNNSSPSINPKMYVYNNKVTIIWLEMRNELFEIYYKTSIDNGEKWNDSNKLTSNTDCYDVEIANEANNIHIVWQIYYEAGWGDIWHMGNWRQNPIITSLSFSHDILYLPNSGFITIDGFDSLYDTSELTCIVQFLGPSNDWQNLSSTFTNSHWESSLQLNKTSETGNYSIRAKLVNPDNNHSEWEIFTDINVLKGVSSNGTPGFELIYLMIGILVFTLMVRINIFNKKEKKW